MKKFKLDLEKAADRDFLMCLVYWGHVDYDNYKKAKETIVKSSVFMTKKVGGKKP